MSLNKILVFCLCLNFFSCNIEPIGDIEISQQENEENENEEEEEEEETPNDTILIKKIIYNKGTADEYSETFNYEGNKLTSVDEGGGTKNVYTYESNNLVKDEYFYEGVLEAYTTLDYNSDEKVASYIETFLETSGLDDRKYKHIITYNNDGTLTNVVYVSYDNAEFELDYTETITLDGKNIAQISDDEGDKVTYDYDDKNGVFKNIHVIEVLNILSENEFGALIYGNTNNMTSYIESGTSTSFSYSETFDFTTYNGNGYPLTAISSAEGEVDETLDFIYE